MYQKSDCDWEKWKRTIGAGRSQPPTDFCEKTYEEERAPPYPITKDR